MLHEHGEIAFQTLLRIDPERLEAGRGNREADLERTSEDAEEETEEMRCPLEEEEAEDAVEERDRVQEEEEEE